jgi:transcriptional regulator with GAF, ATPase, and Fis domain
MPVSWRHPQVPSDKHNPPVVVVCDRGGSLLPLLTPAIQSCSATAVVVDVEPASAIPFTDTCAAALVWLDTPPSGSDLAMARSLHAHAISVIGCAAGSDRWPVSVYCRALLAGCVRVLDCGSCTFADDLRQWLERTLAAAATRNLERQRLRTVMAANGIVADSEAMLRVFRTVSRISAFSDLPVLIAGETGTGKELLARAVHRLDPKRRSAPLVTVNCAAIGQAVAESELFGHRRGAFTGAERDRLGLVRAADGGVLFLDEVGELEPALQAKLLRLLQEGRVLPVGDEREVAVNVRVIAATNRDLPSLVSQRKFREDLFQRLNVIVLHIQPLRERRDDVRPLVEHFVQKHRALSSSAPAVAADFIEALERLPLPGNAREVENVVRQALAQKEDDSSLSLCHLPPAVWTALSGASERDATAPEDPGLDTTTDSGKEIAGALARVLEHNDWNLSQSLHVCERVLFETALHAAHGNQAKTARLLGITARSVYNLSRRHHSHN